MFALKTTILAMVISSSAVMPPDNRNINKPIEFPRISETINYTITNGILPSNIAAVQKDVNTLNSKIEAASPAQTINKDKTYEECMREALEFIYKEVNRLLDEIVNQCHEEFQLHGVI